MRHDYVGSNIMLYIDFYVQVGHILMVMF